MSKQTDNEENRWLHYNEFVFYRSWFLPSSSHSYFSHSLSLSLSRFIAHILLDFISLNILYMHIHIHTYIHTHRQRSTHVYRQNWYAIFLFPLRSCICSWLQKNNRKNVCAACQISENRIIHLETDSASQVNFPRGVNAYREKCLFC